MRDDTGAARILDDRPKAKELLADRGYAADWFRMALIERGIAPCLPPRKNRKIPLADENTRYKQRHKVENMFGRINDWRRVARRYDRCAHTFFSAICIAATVMFYLS
jgi:putative transposase